MTERAVGAFGRARGQGGFTLLELAIVVSLIAVLVGFAIDRLMGLQVDAERVQMQRTIGTLRSAARMEMAEAILHHDLARLGRLDGGNPMALLEQPPPNYVPPAGEPRRGDREPGGIPQPGQWTFEDGYLVYHVKNTDYFHSTGKQAEVRYRLTLHYDDRNGNGRFDPGVDHPRGLLVQAVDDFRWLREPVAPAVADLERQ